MRPEETSRWKLWTLLGGLYVAQGVPYGFFTQTLPVILRDSKASLAEIGGASLLVAPWALKFLWAPFVDRYGFASLGLRRSWLIPIQFASVLALLLLATQDPSDGLPVIMWGVLICNLLAAMQDVATDGLAVDRLPPEARGWTNTLQVGAYRVGMIISGAGALFVMHHYGWSAALLMMAGILTLTSIPVWLDREPPIAKHRAPREAPAWQDVWSFIQAPGMWKWLLVLLVFKFAHQSSSFIFRPWMVDAGYNLLEIGTLLGLIGTGFGLAGAVLGGWLASKTETGRLKSLAILSIAQGVGVSFYLLPLWGEPATWKVIASTGLDHFTSGLATVTLFACMMDRCRPQHSGSDYTLQASIVVVSQLSANLISGQWADRVGYLTHFLTMAVAAALIAVYVGWSTRQLWRGAAKSAAGALGALVLALSLSWTPQESLAQENEAESIEASLGFGPFLPSRIGGVREVLNGWSLRASLPTNKGTFEGMAFNARGEGLNYNTFLASYRVNMRNDFGQAHFLLGLHGDYFTSLDAFDEVTAYRPSGGWHYGGGGRVQISGPVFFRFDFIHRFSPGQSLIVLLGVGMNIPSNSSTGN